MNSFIALAAILTLLLLIWLLRPLLRRQQDSGTTSAALNTALHRDQLQALQTDLARGLISQPDFETARDELPLLISENHGTNGLPAAVTSFAAVPMRIREKVFGVLTAAVTDSSSTGALSTISM